MKNFLDKDFLLESETAKKLFHDWAEKMPICDYHCHLSPQEIYENKQPENISDLWLSGDHYKWRAMRSCGVDENIAPVMQPLKKSLKNLLIPCSIVSAIRFTTGRILNFKGILELKLRLMPKQRMIFTSVQIKLSARVILHRRALL